MRTPENKSHSPEKDRSAEHSDVTHLAHGELEKLKNSMSWKVEGAIQEHTEKKPQHVQPHERAAKHTTTELGKAMEGFLAARTTHQKNTHELLAALPKDIMGQFGKNRIRSGLPYSGFEIG